MVDYIERRDGGFYLTGTRVSLDSLVYAFRAGKSPETIQQEFPLLSLEQVYGAVAFYLGHQAEVDASIVLGEQEVRRTIPALAERKPEAYRRLQKARQQTPARP